MTRSLIAASLLAVSMGTTAMAEAKKDGTTVYLDIRERSETVDGTSGFTSRERVGVKGQYGSFGYNVEGSFNKNYTDDHFDENLDRVSQAYLSYAIGGTTVKAGRQVITLDDHRFIGHVGWRQTYQTFGAVALTSKLSKALTINAGHIYERKGISTNTTKHTTLSGTHEADSYLVAKYALDKETSILPYAYYIKERTTVGGKLAGKVSGMGYTVALASQSGEDSTSGSYMQAGLTAKRDGLLYGVGYELQEKNFATPYATLHKFQGFSDKLLSTAAKGSEDIADASAYIGYDSKSLGLFKLFAHSFEVGTDSATEIDALYKRPIAMVKGMSVLVKYAKFIPADGSTETEKVIVDLNYQFPAKKKK